MNEIPKVSVIIPCRNEEKFIENCLKSIIEQDYPKEKIEIFVIDGLSSDETKKIAENYTKQFDFIKIFENTKQITPRALNIGIKNAKGNFILWMSAHNTYRDNYISKCIEYITRYSVDNVGGIVKTMPRDKNLVASAISCVLSNKFGIGNSVFKTGSLEPKIVDTVFGGCYKREVFDKIGMFNEELVRGQDMEFNLRLKRAGMKTLLVPDIVSYYYARSDFKSFIKHNFLNGIWVILPFKYTKNIPVSLRHLVPLTFVLTLLFLLIASLVSRIFIIPLYIILCLYAGLDILFSLQESILKKKASIFFLLCFLFPALHLSYGLGSFWGLAKCFISKKFWLNIRIIIKNNT